MWCPLLSSDNILIQSGNPCCVEILDKINVYNDNTPVWVHNFEKHELFVSKTFVTLWSPSLISEECSNVSYFYHMHYQLIYDQNLLTCLK